MGIEYISIDRELEVSVHACYPGIVFNAVYDSGIDQCMSRVLSLHFEGPESDGPAPLIAESTDASGKRRIGIEIIGVWKQREILPASSHIFVNGIAIVYVMVFPFIQQVSSFQYSRLWIQAIHPGVGYDVEDDGYINKTHDTAVK